MEEKKTSVEAEKVEEKEQGEVKGEVKEKVSLDSFLEGKTEAPKNLDKELEKEAKKANEQAKKELEHLDKGEEPPKKIKDSKEVKKQDSKEKEVEEEPITPEYRAKYKVPDYIKTHKALAEWGPNAEKNMHKALAEKDKSISSSLENEKRLAKMEAQMEQLSKSLKGDVQDGTITAEEKAIEEEKMRFLMENNPAEFAKLIKEQVRQEALTEAQKKQEADEKEKLDKIKKESKDRQQKEYDEMKERYDSQEEGKFERDILPAIKKIAAERPYLQSFEEAEIIYLHNQRILEEQNKAEEETKRQEKSSSNAEVSHRSIDDSKSDDSIASAIDSLPETASLAELDRAAGLRK